MTPVDPAQIQREAEFRKVNPDYDEVIETTNDIPMPTGLVAIHVLTIAGGILALGTLVLLFAEL